MSQPIKSEKQLIDSKVAKVREVVRNVSNNDIVLALHNFDMDVARTIQAFTAGDLGTALGAWEKNGTSKTKKSKNKKNKATDSSSTTTSTTTETPKISSVTVVQHHQVTAANPSRPTAAANNTKPAASQPIAKPNDSVPLKSNWSDQAGEEEKRAEVDRLLHELDAKSAQVQGVLDKAAADQSVIMAAVRHALDARDRQLTTYFKTLRSDTQTKADRQRAIIQRLQQNPTQKGANEEFARAVAEISELTSTAHTDFTIHADKLIKLVEKLGSGFLPAGGAAEFAEPMAVHRSAPVQQQQKPRVDAPPAQQQNGHQNGTQQVATPQNGKPTTDASPIAKVLNGTAEINKNSSISQTSLASSAGEDSGLGQISPVAQEKHVAQVSGGGFQMQSDGLSAEQLAELQAKVAETLKAQGIDPSILASMSESVSIPRRRPAGGRKQENGNPSNNKDNKKPSKATKT